MTSTITKSTINNEEVIAMNEVVNNESTNRSNHDLEFNSNLVRLSELVHNITMKYASSVENVEELSQELYLKAYETVLDRGWKEPLVIRNMENRAIDLYRRESTRKSWSFTPTESSEDDSDSVIDRIELERFQKPSFVAYHKDLLSRFVPGSKEQTLYLMYSYTAGCIDPEDWKKYDIKFDGALVENDYASYFGWYVSFGSYRALRDRVRETVTKYYNEINSDLQFVDVKVGSN